jgi:hypothetical protein
VGDLIRDEEKVMDSEIDPFSDFINEEEEGKDGNGNPDPSPVFPEQESENGFSEGGNQSQDSEEVRIHFGFLLSFILARAELIVP